MTYLTRRLMVVWILAVMGAPHVGRGAAPASHRQIAGTLSRPTSAAPAAGPEVHPPAERLYAVVVSRETLGQADWKAVCDALVSKYNGRLVTWTKSVTEAREPLATLRPRYACFVAPPDACGRALVVKAHRLTRRLDDDPYTDCLWGIVTGYDAADALRIAERAQPLVLRKVLAGTTGAKVGPFDAGVVFNEGKAGAMRVKEPGGEWEDTKGPKDSTKRIVEYFNKEKPDCFVTSGHATERDWQIGYSYKDGQLRCDKGRLFGVDTEGIRHTIRSPNPKVHLPVGNCLIGHVPGPDCMVTALIHSAGVVQMFGYIVPTWYGKGGWGIQEVYLDQPGRFTLAEAFFVNTQAMLHEIRERFPKHAGTDLRQYDMRAIGRQTGIRDRDCLGLLWDRDTVAFYGDPAYDARPARGNLAWDQRVEVDGDRYVLTITCRRDGEWPKQPVFAFLPHRIDAGSVEVSKGKDAGPVITDDFVMVPLKGAFADGDTVTVTFSAKRAE